MSSTESMVKTLKKITALHHLENARYYPEFLKNLKFPGYKTICVIYIKDHETESAIKVEAFRLTLERSVEAAAELMLDRLGAKQNQYLHFWETFVDTLNNKEWDILKIECARRQLLKPNVLTNCNQQYIVEIPRIHFRSAVSSLSLCSIQGLSALLFYPIPHGNKKHINPLWRADPIRIPKKVYTSSDEETEYRYECGHVHKVSQGRCQEPIASTSQQSTSKMNWSTRGFGRRKH